jgi:hypothetical protein
MRKLYAIATAALLFASCSAHYKFWDISQFDINPIALDDKEEVKVIYTSQGPGNNEDLEYFIHLIVVSQKTGDTVNVLTTINNGFEEDAADRIYNFFNESNPMAKLVHEDLKHVTSIEELNAVKVDLSGIRKVARDPEFDHLARNNYPSIIGWIGTTGDSIDLQGQ